METLQLHLAKQNFKFSSAHFLIFDDKSAELIHGHNYRVKVDIVCGLDTDSKGYHVDFNVLKKYIKSQCDIWDEHLLLPELHPDMKCKNSVDNKNYEVNFRDRFYSFPKNEVIWLKIANTSVENLSRLMAENFMNEFKKHQIKKITVFVEETDGQSASFTLGI